MITYLQENGLSFLLKWFLAIFVFVVFYYISKQIVATIREKIESKSVDPTSEYAKKMSKIIGNMIFILLMIFTLLAVFQVIWFDVAVLMWWISLWLWFAMEVTIGNMISGIMLLTNKKVKMWDFVKFLWSLQLMWTVDEINIRYTVIKTFDKRRVIVPNSIVASTPIQTMKSEPLVRGELIFILPKYVLVSQVKEIIIAIINQHQYVYHKEYTSVGVVWFTNAGIQLKAFFFVSPLHGKSAYVVWKDLRMKIATEFKKYGIGVPYQHITLTVE